MTATSPAAADRSAKEFTHELFRGVDALDAGPYADLGPVPAEGSTP